MSLVFLVKLKLLIFTCKKSVCNLNVSSHILTNALPLDHGTPFKVLTFKANMYVPLWYESDERRIQDRQIQNIYYGVTIFSPNPDAVYNTPGQWKFGC